MVARRTVDLRIEFSSWQYIFIFFLVHGLPALVTHMEMLGIRD